MNEEESQNVLMEHRRLHFWRMIERSTIVEVAKKLLFLDKSIINPFGKRLFVTWYLRTQTEKFIHSLQITRQLDLIEL